MSDLCCCHGLGEPCKYDDGAGRHAHQCLPRYLDLGGHCPDDGCAGECWKAVPSAPADPTETEPEEGR